MTLCKFPLCSRTAAEHGLCISHRIYKDSGIPDLKEEKKAETAPVKPVKKKGIAKKSAKQKTTERALKKLFIEEFAKDPRCKIQSPDCTHQAEGWHHLAKKSPSNVLVKRNLKMACNACNTYIESHTSWAESHGFIKSKFAKA